MSLQSQVTEGDYLLKCIDFSWKLFHIFLSRPPAAHSHCFWRWGSPWAAALWGGVERSRDHRVHIHFPLCGKQQWSGLTRVLTTLPNSEELPSHHCSRTDPNKSRWRGQQNIRIYQWHSPHTIKASQNEENTVKERTKILYLHRGQDNQWVESAIEASHKEEALQLYRVHGNLWQTLSFGNTQENSHRWETIRVQRLW